jgi:hypothetical protein
MMSSDAPAIGRVAFLPYATLRPHRSERRAFQPSPDWQVLKPRAGASVEFTNVRLRVDYFRYIDGPRWARRILPAGSEQLLPQGEAAALLVDGLAQLPHISKGEKS